MAHIMKYGSGDKINMDSFRSNLTAALRDRMSVQAEHKPSRICSNAYRDNFDEIEWSKDKPKEPTK